jgi:hypothetical protein
MHYYRAPNGDYLAVDYGSRGLVPGRYEGRVPAIEGLPSSVCTTQVSVEFLNTCRRILKGEVPREWLTWIKEV